MKKTLYVIYILGLFSCAQQTQPTGGPKDETPPILVESNPKNGQVNFKGSQLELRFSEPIQLNNAKEQIIMSPSVEERQASVKKNTVILKFITPLKDSTTYSVNFREAVQDLTEKNPAVGLKLAFSTGSYLDSLSLSGNVSDLLTAKPLKDVTVAVHYENDTFNIFKHKAEIFTKADESGKFLIENLKSASFYIYAFQDKNKNLIVDGRNEKYGFLSSKFTLINTVENLSFGLVSLDSRDLKLISARPLQNYFSIKTNKGINTYTVEYADNQPIVYTRGDDNASLKVYQTFPVKDSVQARVILSDSIRNTVDTTLYIKFNPPNDELRLDKFSAKLEKVNLFTKTNELTATLQFNKPLHRLSVDSILFKIDSTTHYAFTQEEIKLDTQRHVLTLKKILPRAETTKETIESEQVTGTIDSKKDRIPTGKSSALAISNELILLKGALISIDNDTSALLNQKVTQYKEEDLAITLVETDTKASHFFIELLNNQGQIIKTSYNELKTTFTDINPGEYMLRLVIDINNNKRWDAGNYKVGEEPEPIYYYLDDKAVQKFNLKANWEYGPLLIKTEIPVNNLSTEKKK